MYIITGNYGSCLRDCAAALSPDPGSKDVSTSSQTGITIDSSPTSKKALFRSARALVALGRLDEALDALGRLIRLSDGDSSAPVDPAVVQLQQDIEAVVASAAKRTAEQEERAKRKSQEAEALKSALLVHYSQPSSVLSRC
jgi:tetratricopeptide (TPR) repeat protein